MIFNLKVSGSKLSFHDVQITKKLKRLAIIDALLAWIMFTSGGTPELWNCWYLSLAWEEGWVFWKTKRQQIIWIRKESHHWTTTNESIRTNTAKLMNYNTSCSVSIVLYEKNINHHLSVRLNFSRKGHASLKWLKRNSQSPPPQHDLQEVYCLPKYCCCPLCSHELYGKSP